MNSSSTKNSLMVLVLVLALVSVFAELGNNQSISTISNTIAWGSRGEDVRQIQTRLKNWGYYTGGIDGVYGSGTYAAIKKFQQKNGLSADGVAGPATLRALGLYTPSGGGTAAGGSRATTPVASRGVSQRDDINLLARAVHAEAGAEPYEGKVAVGAVILNRIESPLFPNTLAGVVYQPLAFESVDNGIINRPPSPESIRAAQAALNGWDPTYGSIYFWNPSKPVNKWIWSRKIVRRIGEHVFAL